MRESKYQAMLIIKLRRRFPGCVILKNDSEYMPGVPDLTVLFNNKWGMLEVKESEDAPVRPNQEHYVEMFDKMSFAAFIYPSNEEDVLNELQQTFEFIGSTRFPKR